MTLLQTRVDDQTARKFERAARQRGESTYAYLQRVVKAAAAAAEPEDWSRHWEKLESLNLKPAAKSLAELRAEAGER
jgi:tRNA A37 N6-isopentenylltransferase MiaA